jgi:uncharacterized protein DUF5675
MIPRLTLLRTRSTDQGTPGILLRASGSLLAHTLELPWRENRQRASSIPPGLPPPGEYLCRRRRSPHFGPVYEVTGVPGRSSILIHTGNFGGDVAKGFLTHVLGCIILGLYAGRLQGQLAVMVSRPAVTVLMREFNGAPFTLEVRPWGSSTRSATSSQAAPLAAS